MQREWFELHSCEFVIARKEHLAAECYSDKPCLVNGSTYTMIASRGITTKRDFHLSEHEAMRTGERKTNQSGKALWKSAALKTLL